MKKLLITTAIIVFGVVSSWAQGTVNFANGTATLDAPDFVKLTPQSTAVPATGPTYAVQLYIAPNGTVNPASFVAVGNPVAYSTIDPGYFAGGAIATAFASGTQVALQVRAFNTTQGANYQAASTNPAAQLGVSNIIQNYTLGGQTPPASMIGLTSFNISLVPEPSTIALGVIGAAALLLRRRRA
jgi:hypothetical protein